MQHIAAAAPRFEEDLYPVPASPVANGRARPRLPVEPRLRYIRPAMTRFASFFSYYFFGFFRPQAERVARRT
jgi:hypothetical protein